MCLTLCLAAIALTALSGVPGLAFGRRSQLGQGSAALASLAGALLGAGAALVALGDGRIETLRVAGPLATLPLRLRLDPLAAFFLLPVYVLGGAGALYGTRYWSASDRPESARRLRLCWGLLVASMGAVPLAADAVSFLVAWEVMALAAFLLVVTEDERAEVRQAGWVYLVSTHAGTLALFALFGLLWAMTGSPELRALPEGAARPGATGILFLLALLGFGSKAGLVPLHFWLPAAHANAPSHVSALLSGVVLKMGIYGLLRFLTLVPAPPPAVGLLLLAAGAFSAVFGVLFALGQHDLKRLLAYHSIENIGIIVMGLGLALIGLAADRPAWLALGLGGCLLHVWNHALFKGLLFLSAGSVIHAAGTREMDRLGGVARPMPRSAALFAVGAVAICGLPPLNGFVSELLIYAGLLRVTADRADAAWAAAPLAVPVLALAGALAIACFVKVFGTVFLGPQRSEAAARAHEAPSAMLLAMLPLALGCIGIGMLPALALPFLDRVVGTWSGLAAPPPPLAELLPWPALMAANAVLVGGVVAAGLALHYATRRRTKADAVTWDCGYARPGPRMAYTAASFAQILVQLHAWLLRPRAADATSRELFPAPRRFHGEVPEPVLDGLLAPLWSRLRRGLAPIRAIQQGPIQQYLAMILLALCVLLAALAPLRELLWKFLGW